jgi:hypothetical protein
MYAKSCSVRLYYANTDLLSQNFEGNIEFAGDNYSGLLLRTVSNYLNGRCTKVSWYDGVGLFI